MKFKPGARLFERAPDRNVGVVEVYVAVLHGKQFTATGPGVTTASRLPVRARAGLDVALADLQHGDALVVVALDRLGRDLHDLVTSSRTLPGAA